jgi:hypothetical protein
MEDVVTVQDLTQSAAAVATLAAEAAAAATSALHDMRRFVGLNIPGAYELLSQTAGAAPALPPPAPVPPVAAEPATPSLAMQGVTRAEFDGAFSRIQEELEELKQLLLQTVHASGGDALGTPSHPGH